MMASVLMTLMPIVLVLRGRPYSDAGCCTPFWRPEKSGSMVVINDVPSNSFSVAFDDGIGGGTGGNFTQYQNVTATTDLIIDTEGGIDLDSSPREMSLGETVTISFLFDDDGNPDTPSVLRTFLGTVIRSDPANLVYSGVVNETGEEVELNVSIGFDLSGRTDGYFRDDRQSGGNTVLPCFCSGTKIEGDCGEKLIEHLSVGDRVRTIDGRLKEIRWIGSTHISSARQKANNKLCPIRIPAGAFGWGVPRRVVKVSRQHRIVVESPICVRMFDRRRIFVSAKELCGHFGVAIERSFSPVIYYHLLLDGHDVLHADGALMESFFPGPLALAGLTDQDRSAIRSIFPGLRYGRTPELRLHQPSGKRQRKLLERHARNQKPIQMKRKQNLVSTLT